MGWVQDSEGQHRHAEYLVSYQAFTASDMHVLITCYDRKMAHDDEVYDSPYEFRPERFLPQNSENATASSSDTKANPEPDVREFVFGFGRRSCPGKELADASLFMFAAMSLAVFDFRVPPNTPERRQPKFEFAPGTITCVIILAILSCC